MKIRTKVFTLLAAMFLTLALVEWGVGEALLLPRFGQFDIDNAHTAVTRIDHSVAQVLGGLQTSSNDWGNWADTYRFMLGRDPAYIRDNLHAAAMKQLHLTTLAFIDMQGRVVWSRSVDPVSAAPVELDLFRDASLPASLPWQDNLQHARAGQGLVATNHGLLMAAVAPILDGFGRGPSRGLVVMGRILTAAEVAEIGAKAETEVVLAATRDVGGGTVRLLPSRDAASINEEIVTTAATTQVFRVFKDVYGQPVMTLRVDVPRTITASARATVAYAMEFTVGAAVVVLLVLLLVLDKSVLGPLGQVTQHAIRIGAGDDLTTRLNLNRSDEIGALATEFDRMVAQVAESRRTLIDHSFHAGMAELSRGVLHNIGNAMTPLSVRVAKLQEQLRSAPIADVTRALAERSQPETEANRQADLDEFLRLASGELASVIRTAEADAGIIARQAGIVQNALSDQLRSSRGPTVLEAVDLPAVISQSLEIVPDACREQVSIELDESVPGVGPVRLARTVLRLVLQNLIINAAEAIRAAGRQRGVVRFSAAIEGEAGEDKLLLTCQDTGVGIAAEDLERVFERGYSTKRDSGNLGIGLHWCATAVNALGGRIWATSEGPDRGSTFHLVLPVPAPVTLSNAEAA